MKLPQNDKRNARTSNEYNRASFLWLKNKVLSDLFLVTASVFIFMEIITHVEALSMLYGKYPGISVFEFGNHKYVIGIVLASIASFSYLRWNDYRSLPISGLNSGRIITLLFDALNASPDGVALTLPDSSFVWVNDGMCKLTGYSSEELIGQKPLLFKSGKQDEQKFKEIWNTILNGEIYFGELINQRKDGSIYSEEILIAPLKNSKGVISHFINIRRDISVKKEIQSALQEAESKFNTLVETMNDGLAVMNEVNEITYVNPKLLNTLGYTEKEVLGKHVSMFLDETNYRIAETQHTTRTRGEPLHYTVDLTKKSGVQRTFDVFPRRILNSKGRFTQNFASFTDLTDQIQSDEKNIRLGKILEESPNEIYVFDANTRLFVMVNQGARKNLGYTLDELIELEPLDISQGVSQELFDSKLTALLNKSSNMIEYKCEYVRKNGTTYPVETHLRLLEHSSMPVFVAFVTDITDRIARKNALIEAKEEAESMNKLKSAFLSNMSHEIRTPITAILGYSDVLRDGATDEQLEFIGHVQKAGRRLMDTLISILDLSLLETNNLDILNRQCNLNTIIVEVVEQHLPDAREKNIGLVTHLKTDAKSIILDEENVKRILNHLISNALKFSSRGEINVELVESATIKNGVDIIIRDTGVGISAKFIPHLFDAFKQESTGSARSYNGVGIGLAITEKLVTVMGGQISVESVKSVGSIFTVSFPRTASASEHPSSETSV